MDTESHDEHAVDAIVVGAHHITEELVCHSGITKFTIRGPGLGLHLSIDVFSLNAHGILFYGTNHKACETLANALQSLSNSRDPLIKPVMDSIKKGSNNHDICIIAIDNAFVELKSPALMVPLPDGRRLIYLQTHNVEDIAQQALHEFVHSTILPADPIIPLTNSMKEFKNGFFNAIKKAKNSPIAQKFFQGGNISAKEKEVCEFLFTHWTKYNKPHQYAESIAGAMTAYKIAPELARKIAPDVIKELEKLAPEVGATLRAIPNCELMPKYTLPTKSGHILRKTLGPAIHTIFWTLEVGLDYYMHRADPDYNAGKAFVAGSTKFVIGYCEGALISAGAKAIGMGATLPLILFTGFSVLAEITPDLQDRMELALEKFPGLDENASPEQNMRMVNDFFLTHLDADLEDYTDAASLQKALKALSPQRIYDNLRELDRYCRQSDNNLVKGLYYCSSLFTLLPGLVHITKHITKKNKSPQNRDEINAENFDINFDNQLPKNLVSADSTLLFQSFLWSANYGFDFTKTYVVMHTLNYLSIPISDQTIFLFSNMASLGKIEENNYQPDINLLKQVVNFDQANLPPITTFNKYFRPPPLSEIIECNLKGDVVPGGGTIEVEFKRKDPNAPFEVEPVSAIPTNAAIRKAMDMGAERYAKDSVKCTQINLSTVSLLKYYEEVKERYENGEIPFELFESVANTILENLRKIESLQQTEINKKYNWSSIHMQARWYSTQNNTQNGINKIGKEIGKEKIKEEVKSEVTQLFNEDPDSVPQLLFFLSKKDGILSWRDICKIEALKTLIIEFSGNNIPMLPQLENLELKGEVYTVPVFFNNLQMSHPYLFQADRNKSERQREKQRSKRQRSANRSLNRHSCAYQKVLNIASGEIDGDLEQAIKEFKQIDIEVRSELSKIPTCEGVGGQSNALAINKPELNLRKDVVNNIAVRRSKQTGSENFLFTPQEKQDILFHKGIGLINGGLKIFNDPNASSDEKKQAIQSCQEGSNIIVNYNFKLDDWIRLGYDPEGFESFHSDIIFFARDETVNKLEAQLDCDDNRQGYINATKVLADPDSTPEQKQEAYRVAYEYANKVLPSEHINDIFKVILKEFIDFYDVNNGDYQIYEVVLRINNKVQDLKNDLSFIFSSPEDGVEQKHTNEQNDIFVNLPEKIESLFVEKNLDNSVVSFLTLLKEDWEKESDDLVGFIERRKKRTKFEEGYMKILQGRELAQQENVDDEQIKAAYALEMEGLEQCNQCGKLDGTYISFADDNDVVCTVGFSQLQDKLKELEQLKQRANGDPHLYYRYSKNVDKRNSGFNLMNEGLELICKKNATPEEIQKGFKLILQGKQNWEDGAEEGESLGEIEKDDGTKISMLEAGNENGKIGKFLEKFINENGELNEDDFMAYKIRKELVEEAERTIEESKKVYNNEAASKEEKNEGFREECAAKKCILENLRIEDMVEVDEKTKENVEEFLIYCQFCVKLGEDTNYNKEIHDEYLKLNGECSEYAKTKKLRKLYDSAKKFIKKVDEDGGCSEDIRQFGVDMLKGYYNEASIMYAEPISSLSLYVANSYTQRYHVRITGKKIINSLNILDATIPTLLPDILLYAESFYREDKDIWVERFMDNIQAYYEQYTHDWWSDIDGSWQNLPLESIAKQIALINTLASITPFLTYNKFGSELTTVSMLLAKLASWQHAYNLCNKHKDFETFWRTKPHMLLADTINIFELLHQYTKPLVTPNGVSTFLKCLPEHSVTEKIKIWTERLESGVKRILPDKLQNALTRSHENIEQLFEEPRYYLGKDILIKGTQILCAAISMYKYNNWLYSFDTATSLTKSVIDWEIGAHYEKAYQKIIYESSRFRQIAYKCLDAKDNKDAEEYFKKSRNKINELKMKLVSDGWGATYQNNENQIISEIRAIIYEFECAFHAKDQKFHDIITLTAYSKVDGAFLIEGNKFPLELMPDTLIYRLEALLSDKAALLKDPMIFYNEYHEIYYLIETSQRLSRIRKESTLTAFRKIATYAFDSYARIAYLAAEAASEAASKKYETYQSITKLLAILDDSTHVLRHVNQELTCNTWHMKGLAYYYLNEPLKYIECFQNIKIHERQIAHWEILGATIQTVLCVIKGDNPSAINQIKNMSIHCIESTILLLQRAIEDAGKLDPKLDKADIENLEVNLSDNRTKLNILENELRDKHTVNIDIAEWIKFIENNTKFKTINYIKKAIFPVSEKKFGAKPPPECTRSQSRDAVDILRMLNKEIPTGTFFNKPECKIAEQRNVNSPTTKL